jgi:hypothetical protein
MSVLLEYEWPLSTAQGPLLVPTESIAHFDVPTPNPIQQPGTTRTSTRKRAYFVRCAILSSTPSDCIAGILSESGGAQGRTNGDEQEQGVETPRQPVCPGATTIVAYRSKNTGHSGRVRDHIASTLN